MVSVVDNKPSMEVIEVILYPKYSSIQEMVQIAVY